MTGMRRAWMCSLRGPGLVVAALGACPSFALAACSSSSSTSTPPVFDSGAGADTSISTDTGTDAGTDAAPDTLPDAPPDAGPDVILDPQNCVPPGTASNAEGVGGYCSPGGGQCANAGPGGTPTICTADVVAVPHGWFCTIPCDPDGGAATCGNGAGCDCLAQGCECVPAACTVLEDGGGTPADGSAEDSAALDADNPG